MRARLAPEERASEQRQARVDAQRPQKRAQRVWIRDRDGGEQDEVRPLRASERERQRRAGQGVEQVLRLPELEGEVLLRRPGGVPTAPQGRQGGDVLRQIGEGQGAPGPERG